MIFESYFLGRLFVVPVLSVIRCDASSQSLWCKAAAVQDPERTNDQEVNDTRTFSSLLVKMSQIYMRQIHAVRREDPPPPPHTHTHTHTHACKWVSSELLNICYQSSRSTEELFSDCGGFIMQHTQKQLV